MEEKEFSVLIGGEAGDGVKFAGALAAKLFNRLGYWTFVYVDYPSLIRGGHNFAIIRAKSEKISGHKDKIDVLVALNDETARKHAARLKKGGLLIFDSSSVKEPAAPKEAKKAGVPLGEIVKAKGLPPIARNSAALGALAAALKIELSAAEALIKSSVKKKPEENAAAAAEAAKAAAKAAGFLPVRPLENAPKPLLTGNEAIALGAVKAGLKAYIAYPMTPATSILHYLAENKKELGVAVVQPENEIATIGMAQGAAFAGAKSMIGTSGGGFALMIEPLSLAGQAEIPTVIVLSQRPGPSTGVPTYTAQADLLFALHAGHGEFPRIVLAPGDAEQAFRLAADALNLAWKFQVPVILLSDKHLSESVFAADFDENGTAAERPKLWDGKGEYKRYAFSEDGISPLAFPGEKNAVVKSNSYEHDERGISVESRSKVVKGCEKRIKKAETIKKELDKEEAVKVYGDEKSEKAVIFWGSVKGAAAEAAAAAGFKAVQPLRLEPFPRREMEKRLKGVRKIVNAEVNSTGQLGKVLKLNGFKPDESVLKYDGRPFSVDELAEKLKKI